MKYVPEEQYNAMLNRMQAEKEQAYKDGFEDGKQMGLATGLEESKKVAEGFNGLIASVRNQQAEIYRQAEEGAVDLAIAIARKIIGAKADSDPSLIVDAAKKAVRLLLDKSSIVVKIAPEQEEFVSQNLDKFYAMDDRIQKVEIEADRRVQPGGCVLETDSGIVDTRIEVELQSIEKALKLANQTSVQQ